METKIYKTEKELVQFMHKFNGETSRRGCTVYDKEGRIIADLNKDKVENDKPIIVYLSGRISGMPLEWAETNFFNAQCEVTKFYNADTIVNPLNIRPFLGVKKWLFYMISDLWQLRKCTHIAMQKNWIDSKGCHWEHYFAKFIFKIKVIYL